MRIKLGDSQKVLESRLTPRSTPCICYFQRHQRLNSLKKVEIGHLELYTTPTSHGPVPLSQAQKTMGDVSLRAVHGNQRPGLKLGSSTEIRLSKFQSFQANLQSQHVLLLNNPKNSTNDTQHTFQTNHWKIATWLHRGRLLVRLSSSPAREQREDQSPKRAGCLGLAPPKPEPSRRLSYSAFHGPSSV